VTWRYKSEVVDSLSQEMLDPEDRSMDTPVFRRPVVVTDLAVLAESALQIAMGEEDVADATLTADDRFFSPVYAD